MHVVVKIYILLVFFSMGVIEAGGFVCGVRGGVWSIVSADCSKCIYLTSGPGWRWREPSQV